MVYHCLGCGKELTKEDTQIPLYETVDKWGTQKFRGKVCYTCYTEP